MRGKTLLTCLALALALTVGCKQQCYLTECDYEHYHHLALPNLECNPAVSVLPSATNVGAPPTVDNPERERRYLSLNEAIAIGLEYGTIGNRLLTGTTDDTLAIFSGTTVASPENNIRVLSLDPAAVASSIEASLAKFDAQWISSATWMNDNTPVGTALEALQLGGAHGSISTENASISTGLFKPLPTGGVAGISFSTDYTYTSAPTAPLNPAYTPKLLFQFEQPLLQGYGVEINQLRATHPGSLLTPITTGGRVEGILITRIRFDQARAEFERNLHDLLANVEVAYWNLYGAYGQLYSQEQALRQVYNLWQYTRRQFEAGKLTSQDYYQVLGQYELFRGLRLEALNLVLEDEHQLRGLLGLPVEDGTRLVPADVPTLAPYHPDWSSAVNEALALRPELVLARQDLKFRQLDLINRKNLLLPDLRFLSSYDITGLGTHLDGGSSDPNNAFHVLATDKFYDWTLGLRLTVPLGFRDAHANVREGRLLLARSYQVLRDQERKAQRYVDEQYRAVFDTYALIGPRRSQREARGREMRERYRDFVEGRGTLNLLLEAERFWAEALRLEYLAIGDYNGALARFEYSKGTIMERDNVTISEGPLPNCAQVRAVDHERERTQAFVVRERAKVRLKPPAPNEEPAFTDLMAEPSATAPSLPSLMEGQSPLPPDGEMLPSPQREGGKRSGTGGAPGGSAAALGGPAADRWTAAPRSRVITLPKSSLDAPAAAAPQAAPSGDGPGVTRVPLFKP
jgi:outer membrane protein TolC